jgi:hypothetical protein
MPDLMPAHQVVLQTGMMGSIGGFDFLLPMIWGNLKNTSFIEISKFLGLVRNLVKTSPRIS